MGRPKRDLDAFGPQGAGRIEPAEPVASAGPFFSMPGWEARPMRFLRVLEAVKDDGLD